MLKHTKAKLKVGRGDKYTILKELLESENSETGEGTILHDKNGRPYTKDAKWYISMSDSGEMSAVAISRAPVGIDIQKCVEKPLVREKYFSEVEKQEPFARIWARKEAYGKYLGTGLTSAVLKKDTAKLVFFERELEGGFWLAVYEGDSDRKI